MLSFKPPSPSQEYPGESPDKSDTYNIFIQNASVATVVHSTCSQLSVSNAANECHWFS